MRGQFGESIFPANFLKVRRAACTASVEWIGEAVGVVQHLERGVAPGAELAAVDGMIRIAFNFSSYTHGKHVFKVGENSER
jgi:hypothetical protein